MGVVECEGGFVKIVGWVGEWFSGFIGVDDWVDWWVKRVVMCG